MRTFTLLHADKNNESRIYMEFKLKSICCNIVALIMTAPSGRVLQIASWSEMTDIINIVICCKFAYHVEFGFICEVLNCTTQCCKSKIVWVRLVIYNLPLSLEVKQSPPMHLMYYWIRFSWYPSCILVCHNVAILYTISRQTAISANIENEEWVWPVSKRI